MMIARAMLITPRPKAVAPSISCIADWAMNATITPPNICSNPKSKMKTATAFLQCDLDEQSALGCETLTARAEVNRKPAVPPFGGQ